jgi:hypothetical protein
MPKDFFIDEDTGRFVRSYTDTSQETPSNLFRGDIRDARLYFLRQTGVFGRPYRAVDRSGVDGVTFAIGDILASPASGTFTLTFDGDTTAAIAFDATATAVAAALNALASVISAGGVTVQKFGTIYVVTFTSVGARTAVTGSAALLSPLSGLFINVRTEGDGSTREVVTIELAVANAAQADTWTAIDTTVTPTVSEIVAGDATNSEVQRILFSQAPALGTFSLSIPEYTRTMTAAVAAGVFITTSNHGATLGQPVIPSDFDTPVNFSNGVRFFVSEILSPTSFRVSPTEVGVSITNATATAATATLTFPGGQTDRLDYDATTQTLTEAFEALPQIGVGNASVTRLSESEIIIAFRAQKAFAELPNVTVLNFLEGLTGLQGSLNLATERVRELLAEAASVALTAEVQILDDGDIETVAQSEAAITRDIITGSTIAPQLGFSTVPISAGGTGATSAAAAVTALGLPATGNIATLSGTQTITGVKTFTGNAFPVAIYERAVVGASGGLFGAFALQVTSTGAANDGGGPIFAGRIQGSGMASPSTIAQIGFARAGANNTGEVIIQPLNAGSAVNALVAKPSGNIVVRGSIEIEGTTISANKAILSAQDPTDTRTYRLANAPTTATLDVVAVLTKTDTGDPASGYEGQMVINTFDNTLKVYADAGWRQIATW